MTRDETAKLMILIRGAYPQFYNNMSSEEARGVLGLWHEMFSEENFEVVKYAMKRLIKTHGKFPPTIADVSEKIEELKRVVSGEPTNEDLWLILRSAIFDGQNGAEEHFDKMPPVLKRYCGSPQWIRDHASQEAGIIDSVLKGQFMKQIADMKNRVDYEESLPVDVRNQLSALYAMKRLDAGEKRYLSAPTGG